MKPTKLVMSIIYSVVLFVLISLLFLSYDILWAVFCVIFILILTIGIHRIKTLKEESERYKNQSDVWKERYKEALKKKSKFGTSKAEFIADQPDVPYIYERKNNPKEFIVELYGKDFQLSRIIEVENVPDNDQYYKYIKVREVIG